MPSERLVFGFHAIQRMYLRGISVGDVRQVVATGEVVEEYPDDMPYPSKLLLGWRGGKPLHVVAARNRERKETIIVTVYEPDPARWELDFRRRKR